MLLSQPRLRESIRITPFRGGAKLLDQHTGLQLELGRDASALLSELGGERASGHTPAEIAFLQQVAELGLLQSTPAHEAIQRQGRYVLEQALRGQRERVQRTIEEAFATTLLHCSHLNGAGSRQLQDLPLLTRADLRRHFPAGLARSDVDLRALLKRGDVVVATTSGSSGERLQVYSDTRIPRLLPHMDTFWGLPGLGHDRPIRTAVFTSAICSGITCTAGRKPLSQRLVLDHTLFLESPNDVFALERSEVEHASADLHEFAPDLLFGNPIYLLMLARAAAEFGVSLPRPRALVLCYQLASAAQRRLLRQLYGVPIFDMYTATELGGSQIGISCEHGRLHVRLDHVFVELLHAGAAVAHGELGALTVTTHNPVMPLIRYALGDLARFQLTPCHCSVGSAWPSLTLEGRERDAFQLGGVVITSRQVDAAVGDLDLVAYQLREHGPGQFEFAVVSDMQDGSWRRAAEQALLALLEPRSLTIRRLQQLPLDASQKFRFTIPYVE